MVFLNKKTLRRIKRAGLILVPKKEYDLYWPHSVLEARIAKYLNTVLVEKDKDNANNP